MELFKWRPSFATGISEMDNQHKKLIGLINTMYEVLRQRQDSREVEKVLEEMIVYSTLHFQTEEELLAAHGYQQIEQQKILHGSYILRLQELEQDYKAMGGEAALEVYQYLRIWWKEHILNEDMLYSQFLKDKGIS